MLSGERSILVGKVEDVSMNEKVILLNSGGLDSLTSAGMLLTGCVGPVDLIGLNINYGQVVGPRERLAAELWTEALQKKFGKERISLETMELRDYNQFVSTNPVVRGQALGAEVDPKENFVPGRNIVFLLFAAIYGYKKGIRKFVLSAQESDHVSGDLSTAFQDSMANMLAIGMGTYGQKEPYKVWSPLLQMGWTKGDAAKWLVKNEFPVELSWSCYSIGSVHCGDCHNCRDRKEAFKEAGVDDPTEYVK